MKITIAGYGYVGKAVDTCLSVNHATYIVDPKINKNKINGFSEDALIICVSTPQGEDGSCDMRNVLDCIEQAAKNTPILIKSTISIEGWQQIKELYPKRRVTFSPEFLRAETAIEDFITQKSMYLSEGNHEFWLNIFHEALPNAGFKTGTAEELILTKYFRNSFLATKVSFFNQVYDLCKVLNTNYSKVITYVSDDERIGDSHSNVTQERGFGGHCFPKDIKAIMATANKHNCDLSLIKEVVKYNSKVRRN